jgi:hypothetical protein
VYKQFRREKPDFFGYYDLKTDINRNGKYNESFGFDPNLDFEFTGGMLKLK